MAESRNFGGRHRDLDSIHDSFIGRQKVAQTREPYWFNFSMTEGFTSIGIFLKGTLHLVVSVEIID